MEKSLFIIGTLATAICATTPALAAPVYLNETLIEVSVGAGTSPGTFNNTFLNGQTINKVIDAPSADAEEFHNQITHIWFTADSIGGGLELEFDFKQAWQFMHAYLETFDRTASQLASAQYHRIEPCFKTLLQSRTTDQIHGGSDKSEGIRTRKDTRHEIEIC